VPPDAAHHVSLSQTLTDMVCQQKQAIWVANQRSGDAAESLETFADAQCVPLVHDDVVLGAIHAYLEQGRFRQSDFDFLISLANIRPVAWGGPRHERHLTTDYQNLASKLPAHSEIIGSSQAMMELKSKITRMARATGCVLITGESGTGKE